MFSLSVVAEYHTCSAIWLECHVLKYDTQNTDLLCMESLAGYATVNVHRGERIKGQILMDHCTTQPPNGLGLACKTIRKAIGSMLILLAVVAIVKFTQLSHCISLVSRSQTLTGRVWLRETSISSHYMMNAANAISMVTRLLQNQQQAVQ